MKIAEDGKVITKEIYKAILVAGSLDGEDISNSVDELRGLAEAADIEVIGTMIQNMDKINAATYIGTGKVEELAEMVQNMEANLVVFNDELSGMQLRNIENFVNVRTIDRTILILDIFASRAQSSEGKLQVEMAQLQYRMPRLLGFGRSLSRLGGGIGTRGPGETKLETDRRHIEHRLDEIKKELLEVKNQRNTQRQKRENSELPVVALVGYTNSGKSSIMNSFMAAENREEKKVFEKNMLFATLDTAQRLVTLDDNHSFILIDTVGFVSKLPHSLVSAFKATLEEVLYADLLVNVVDASFNEHDFHIDVTDKVLKDLGAENKEKILVFNKKDLVPDFDPMIYGKDALAISAKSGDGMEDLITKIKEKIFADLEIVELLIPFTRGDIVSSIREKANPIETKYEENGTYLRIELGEADRNRYKEFII